MILDTTVLIDVLRDEEDVSDLVEDIDDSGAAFVSSVTVMELAEGIRLADATDREQRAVEDLLREINEITFDRDCAMKAGRLNADLISAGERIDETDVMNAATALVHDQPVVTRNVEHLERIDGLEVVSY